MPGGKICDYVASDNQDQLGIGLLGPKLLDRVDAVRRTTTIDFEWRSDQIVAIIGCRRHHGESKPRIGDLAGTNLLPRPMSDHKQHLVKVHSVSCDARYGEMADMNRVECSAEDANSGHAEHASVVPDTLKNTCFWPTSYPKGEKSRKKPKRCWIT